MFGIKMPRNTKEALLLDCQNGNTLWADIIEKEMKKPVALSYHFVREHYANHVVHVYNIASTDNYTDAWTK